MAQLTAFGVSVKKKLIDVGKTQEWLISEVRCRTGMFMDSSYLRRLLTGNAKSAPMCGVICDILDIKEETK